MAAAVLGVFPPDDLAVIRVRGAAGTLRPATFGRSSAVRVGEIVLAMGNPLGLTGTVTDGIVSATGRTVSEGQGSSTVLISAIQTSAPINPGNSGGALVSLSGQVIGIPTLAASDPQMGGAAVGIGFAIPSDTVTSIARQLVASGKVANSGRAALGITAETLADATEPAGMGVVTAEPGGPAAHAGIRAGDIILAVDGKATDSVTGLQSVLAAVKPGDQVRVRLSRTAPSVRSPPPLAPSPANPGRDQARSDFRGPARSRQRPACCRWGSRRSQTRVDSRAHKACHTRGRLEIPEAQIIASASTSRSAPGTHKRDTSTVVMVGGVAVKRAARTLP